VYKFKFHPEAKKELEKLNNAIQILFTKKLKQIISTPELGIDLGNKNNFNLTGFKKTYFNNRKHRIVYEVLENKIVIHSIAIGKREEMHVYKKADERVNKK
jgi:mRNA interferase RelE/StbE